MRMSRGLLTVFSFSLFALASAWAQTTPSPAGELSGVEGTISISPVKGGPIREGESSSKPLGNTPFEVSLDGRSVCEFQTDEQGHFRVLLPPGHYVITRKNRQAIGFYGPFEVTVV